MKTPIKKTIARATGSHTQMNKKFMEIRNSWNEVDKILQSTVKHKKKKKDK